MAEIEYEGIKLGGSKLLLVIPLLGTIGGGLWAGFEFYKDYMDMKEQIQEYVAPDLSGFDKRIAVMNEHMETVDIHMNFVEKEIGLFKEEIAMLKEDITTANDYSRDMKSDLRNDIIRTEKIMDKVENDMNSLETKTKDLLDETEEESKELIEESENDMKKIKKEVKDMIDIAEQRFDNKRDSLITSVDAKKNSLESDTERKLKDLENRINKLVQRALDNPLSN